MIWITRTEFKFNEIILVKNANKNKLKNILFYFKSNIKYLIDTIKKKKKKRELINKKQKQVNKQILSKKKSVHTYTRIKSFYIKIQVESKERKKVEFLNLNQNKLFCTKQENFNFILFQQFMMKDRLWDKYNILRINV